MQTVAATNWITLAGILIALVVQLVLAGWWIGRKFGTHEIKLVNAIATEREHRSRAISEHARAVSVDVEKARHDAAVAIALISEHKVYTANRFGEYPTKTELRAILSDNLTPVSDALNRLLNQAPARRRKSDP